mgnify:FL=1
MFANIGGKIKTPARIICVLGIVISIFGGLILIKEDIKDAVLKNKKLVTESVKSWVDRSERCEGFQQDHQ